MTIRREYGRSLPLGSDSREVLWQGLALIVFHISYRINDVFVSPQIFLTSAVSPRAIFTFPTTRFSQFSSCIRFERYKYFFGFASSGHNRMHVVGPYVHGPQIPSTNLAGLSNTYLNCVSLI
jgi:hypothetical protein